MKLTTKFESLLFKLTRSFQKISIYHIVFISMSSLLVSCSSVQYYSSLVHGHAEVLNQAREIDEVLADKTIDSKLRTNLQEMKQARLFAIGDLHLPDSGSYLHYSDLGRKYIAWNVIATREFSIEAHEWCFLIAGCIQYRGYYSEDDATEFAVQLKLDGYDVYVAGVDAYSTLGWFDDPILNTMMYRKPEDRLNLLFHEMAHQKVYVNDDSKFNEAFATVVAEEGVVRWLKKHNKTIKVEAYKMRLKNKSRFYKLLIETRVALEIIYLKDINEDEMRALKKLAFAKLKEKYSVMRQDKTLLNFDLWMSQDLNNAHLALVATYNEYVPFFKNKLAEHDGDLISFYASVNQLAKQNLNARRQVISASSAASTP